MPARFLLLLALSLPWLTGCQAPDAAGASNRVTIITGAFPAVTPGMTAAEVRQRLGHPAEIQPMAAAGASAEVWVYYLEKSLGRTAVLTGMSGVLSSGSLAGEHGPSGLAPDYLMAERRLFVTLRVLLVNGQVSAHTARSEERLEF
jgi:hypothetical protein